LRRFPVMLARRAAIAARYHRRWASLPVRLPPAVIGRTHVYHRFVVALPSAATGIARRLQALGVTARQPVFRPLHMALGLSGFPGTLQAFRHALSLPLYPALTSREEAVVARALLRVLG
jgi:dTDP-4-amino-4,6-dideoxygalactose transaminase